MTTEAAADEPGALMRAEMQEQPRRLAEVAARRDEVAGEVRAVLPPSLAGTILVGRGSFDHAAQVGRYLIEMSTGRPVSLGAPSVLLRYGARSTWAATSWWRSASPGERRRSPTTSSGRGRRGRGRSRSPTTRRAPSPVPRSASLTSASARSGRSRPRSTVTAQLLMLALVARACGAVAFDDDDLARLPGSVAAVLEDPPPARSAAEVLAGCAHLLCAARGVLMGAALEVGLKLEEVAGRPVTSFASGDSSCTGPSR